ncbi:MAG: hypothetical protein U0V73_16490 [Acidimicrobiia bacterium]
MNAGYVAGGVQSLAQVVARYDAIAKQFPASTCVVFVNLNTHALPPAAQAINDHLRNNPALFPHVVDWDAAWQARYFDAPGDAHPNATGRQAMLALEDAAIATCPRERARV